MGTLIASSFYYIQNEDISNQGSETEQGGGGDKGSTCPRGPRGPAGPPGIEVGIFSIFSCNTAHHAHTACCARVSQPPWFCLQHTCHNLF